MEAGAALLGALALAFITGAALSFLRSHILTSHAMIIASDAVVGLPRRAAIKWHGAARVRAPGVLIPLRGLFLLSMIVDPSQVRSTCPPCAHQHSSLHLGCLLLLCLAMCCCCASPRVMLTALRVSPAPVT